MVVKVYARLYKYTPTETMELTVAQVLALLPDEVEKSIVEAAGRDRHAEQLAGAVAALRARTGRDKFTEQEVNGEIWRLYG